MKTVLLISLLLLSSSCFASQVDKEMIFKPISITINGIELHRGGQIILFVFAEEGFPKAHDKALKRFALTPEETEVTLDAWVPIHGKFALKVLHDENMDGQVTKNWTGIVPKDGMGFSSGAKIRFGPPKFSDASIAYHHQLSPIITIQY